MQITKNLHQRSAYYQLKVCHYFGGDKGGGGVKENSEKV